MRGCLFFIAFLYCTGWIACTSGYKQPYNTASLLIPLPPGIQQPALPEGVTLTPEKVELGRYLFFDRRLSFNNTKSCASCHDPRFAFTDGYRRSLGATADMHQRNAQPIVNMLWLERLTSADTSLLLPEQQMQQPFFNAKFVELGAAGREKEILSRIKADSFYTRLFKQAFPAETNAVQFPFITSAIASFIRTITSFNSPYDQYRLKKDSSRFSQSAKRGEQLFFSSRLQCSQCHSGDNFSDGLADKALPVANRLYFNTGLYNINGRGAYPAADQGLYIQTKNMADMGKFRVPTLRNLAFTGPYWHDGSAATLDEVIDVYALGGRLIDYGDFRGDGKLNPHKNPLVNGFTLSKSEKADLISFLFSLSDSTLINNPAYQNPFKADETTGY